MPAYDWAAPALALLAQTGGIDWSIFSKNILASFLYTAIGLFFFGLAFWVICKVCPFSIRKEIEEDQNTSLAIIIGSVILGIAMIISAAVHG
jgi:putative membrane protein